jgi:outer membrane protein OmpA-like peptidoglycan-associated protein
MKFLNKIGVFPLLFLAAGCMTAPESPPQAVQAPPPAPAPQPVAQAGSTAPEDVQIFFATGSSVLDSEAQSKIDYTARLFREGNPFVMTVAGHTDSTGPDFANLLLSAHRAEAVKQALISRGIPAERLQTQALGESDPAVPAGDEAAEAKNRRVRITWK